MQTLLLPVDLRTFPSRRAFNRREVHSVSPPSTMTVWPVTIAAPAHRKKMTSAMSSGLQARFRGVFSTDCCLRSSGQSLFHGLSTKPGATALTRISGAKVRAKLRVRLMRPALLVAYGMLLPDPITPAIEAVLQIAPPAAFSAGTAAWAQRNGPIKLVVNILDQNSSVSASRSENGIGVGVAGVPALLTRKSSRPSASTAPATIRSACPGCETSP